jgi:hypothetical protein
MDLAVILPLAALLAGQVRDIYSSICQKLDASCDVPSTGLTPWPHLLKMQVLIALLLLAPRAVSKHVAGLMILTKTNTVGSTVVHTTAVALLAVTVSSLIQLLGITKTMAAPQYDG